MKILDLGTEYNKYYKNSDLQKIVTHKPVPIKEIIDGMDCYFYNTDFAGLMEWKIKKDGLTPYDFAIDYKRGFEAGLKHLKKEAGIKLRDLKNDQTRTHTIDQLKYILYELEFRDNIKGLLNVVFKHLPLVFTEENIKNFGYWNAIVHTIDDLCERAGLRENYLTILETEKSDFKLPENKFDNTPMIEVYKYFKTHLVDRNRMSNKDLINYLTDAFELQKLPLKPYKLKDTEIQAGQKIFYTFYINSGKPHGKGRDYANLLGGYFERFKTENVYTNWNK